VALGRGLEAQQQPSEQMPPKLLPLRFLWPLPQEQEVAVALQKVSHATWLVYQLY